jgi:hypothetical protein
VKFTIIEYHLNKDSQMAKKLTQEEVKNIARCNNVKNTMAREITISYHFDNVPTSNHNVVGCLEEHAMERIKEQMNEGYTGGELNAYVPTGKKEVQYTGWWSMTTKCE